MFFFSNLFSFLLFLDKWPPYASNVVIEIIRDKSSLNGQKYVRIFFNDEILQYSTLLTHSEKDKQDWITYESFLNLLKESRISHEDYVKFCSEK
jgi:hypothetical protein